MLIGDLQIGTDYVEVKTHKSTSEASLGRTITDLVIMLQYIVV